MAKRLFDVLLKCKDEEEVKAAYAKFFKMNLNTHIFRIDLYTETVLFEFKYEKNFEDLYEKARAVAQTLYYIRKLKYGSSILPVPSAICIADKKSAFIIVSSDFSQFYNASARYDWDRAASQPCPELVKALKISDKLKKIHIYNLENEEEENLFVQDMYVRLQEKSLGDTDKKEITTENFVRIYAHWYDLFGEYVKNGHKASEYFVSDIEYGRSEKINDSEVLFKLGDGTVSKNVPMETYEYFWNKYEKISNSTIIKIIRQQIDQLSEDFGRRFTGEFFTPIDFAEKAFEYIKRIVGSERYKKGNWRIWDMAAGTGNLEYMLPSSVLDNCYISTLLEDDANYCKRIFPSATVFQYDYLNDDIDFISSPGSLKYSKPKMPKKLYDDLQNPDICWIVFINPPFATSNASGNTVGKKSKTDVSMTYIREMMNDENYGETSRELFSQFLYRISKEFSGKTAYLGLFSKIKYLNSNNDQKLRDGFFQFKFESGFVFSSENFSGTKGLFPIGFIVWNLKQKIKIEDQSITLDVYNNHCEKIGTKEIQTVHRNSFLNKWVTREKNTKVFPPFVSGISISSSTRDVRDKITDNFICSLQCKGNDFQNQNYVTITSGPNASAGAYSVTPSNFEKSMVLHAVRRIPKATWDRDRDQFYQPTIELPEEFIYDCIIWSAFSSDNSTVALKDVEYKGKIYQIHNEMFPFLLDDVNKWGCKVSSISRQLFSANEDRFMAKWISTHSLSNEATQLLLDAKAFYQCVFANLHMIQWKKYKIDLWDIGFWQIKEAAKEIDKSQELYSIMKESRKVLEEKINSHIAEYGFLPPDIVKYEE